MIPRLPRRAPPVAVRRSSILELTIVEDEVDDPSPVPRVGVDVLQEVLEYRELRARAVRGRQLSPAEHARLEELEQKHQRQLGRGELASLRRFVRFSCALSGHYRRYEGGVLLTTPVSVEDVGVGGARVTLPEPLARPGDQAVLAVELTVPGEPPRTVVLPTRVVWARSGDSPARELKLGVAFAGPARYGPDLDAVVGRPTG